MFSRKQSSRYYIGIFQPYIIYVIVLEYDLAKKYGEGSVIERPCPECGFIVELQSSGVHSNDNGCVTVYSQDDDFDCPRCSRTDQGNKQIAQCAVEQPIEFVHVFRHLSRAPASHYFLSFE